MLKKEMKDNQKLKGLDGQMGEMRNDFEDMKRTREEARKQLEAKFQDIYKKLAALKEALETEAKRVNNSLKAFESKFLCLLNELKEELKKDMDDEKKFVRDKFAEHEKHMEEIEKKLEQEREERLKQNQDTLGNIQNRLTLLEEAQKQIQNMTSELIPTNIAVSALKIKALNSGNFQVTLTDSKGNVLANKTVSIIINGVTKKVTTDDKGIAKLSVKYSKAGTYNAVVTYMGDKTYAATVATGKITVTKKATKITAPKKKFKVKKKTKKVKITLKSEGKALAKKKVTLTVKGKTFKAKTNSKGVATIKVKLNKRGTFKYKVKFAGDGAYKAVSKKGKIVIKK